MDLKRKLARLQDAGPESGGRKPNQAAAPPRGEELEAEGKRARIARGRALIEQVSARYQQPDEVERLRQRLRGALERHHPGPASSHDGGESLADDSLEHRPLDVTDGQLPGGPRETPHGEVHVAVEHLEPGHCQGRLPVGAALEVGAEALAHLALDPALAGVDFNRMLLLDTETTGLVGGTGTVPFLVGLAYFEDQSLRVEQLFLRELGREAPLLWSLRQRLEQATVLVTYNGKTFDWPLLRTRYVMNQLELPVDLPHLDLLHCARRVYKRRLGELRLVHLEEHLLGLRREHDVEGAEIPIRYLDFLRSGREGQLVPVIEHNAHDLISLAAVMGVMGKGYQQLVTSGEPEDHLGYARVAHRNGDRDRALSFARAAARGGGRAEVTVDALMMVASLERLRGELGAQRVALEQALEAAGYVGALAAPVHLALAKLCEHKLRDLPRALRHAELAAEAEGPEASLRRCRRLVRRLARAG